MASNQRQLHDGLAELTRLSDKIAVTIDDEQKVGGVKGGITDEDKQAVTQIIASIKELIQVESDLQTDL